MQNELSIYIPCYNSEKYIGETLSSLANQTFKDFDCVVMDNCSSDKTVEIARNYKDKFKNLEIITNPRIIIGEENFNQCLRHARREFLCIYHSDDIYEPNIVEKSIKFLKKYPECGMVSTMAKVVNENGKTVTGKINLAPRLKRLKKETYEFKEILQSVLDTGFSYAVFPSIMMRRKAIESTEGFEYDKYRYASDAALWIKISASHKVGIINEHLVRYRCHPGQGTQLLVKSDKFIPDIMRVMRYYRKTLRRMGLMKNYNGFIAHHLSLLCAKRMYASNITYVDQLYCLALKHFVKSNFSFRKEYCITVKFLIKLTVFLIILVPLGLSSANDS